MNISGSLTLGISLVYTSETLQQDIFIKTLDEYNLWPQICAITPHPDLIDEPFFIRPSFISQLSVKGTTFEVDEDGAVSIPRLGSPNNMRMETLKWIFGRTDISKDLSKTKDDKTMFMNVISSVFDNDENANKIFRNHFIRRITNAGSTMVKVDFCKTILIPESALASEEILREHFHSTFGSSLDVWLSLNSEVCAGAENYPNRTITHNNATDIRYENNPPMEESRVTEWKAYNCNKDGLFRPIVSSASDRKK